MRNIRATLGKILVYFKILNHISNELKALMYDSTAMKYATYINAEKK